MDPLAPLRPACQMIVSRCNTVSSASPRVTSIAHAPRAGRVTRASANVETSMARDAAPPAAGGARAPPAARRRAPPARSTRGALLCRALAASLVVTRLGAADADLRASRPFPAASSRDAGPLAVAASGVPRAHPAGSTTAGSDLASSSRPDPASNDFDDRQHGPDFLAWARRHDKLGGYCPGALPPCAESLHREGIWRENARLIDEHNRASGSLMKKGLTRFADLTVDEFTSHHATYSAPLVGGGADSRGIRTSSSSDRASSESGASNGGVFGVADSFSDDDRDSRQPQRGLSLLAPLRAARRRASDDGSSPEALTLKAATDAAARRGDALPSEAGESALRAAAREPWSLDGVFPALGKGTASRSRSRGGKRRNEADVPDFVGFFSGEADPEATDASDRDGRDGSGASPSEAVGSGQSSVGSGPSSVGSGPSSVGSGPLGTDHPRRFDWSDLYDFGAVVHQGSCAGCWAYSTAAVVEAANAIAGAEHVRLSPYSLLDCDGLDRGCATGNMASAYSWIQTSEFGLPPLDKYPTRSSTGACDRRGLKAGYDPKRTRGGAGASANARGVASANLGDLPAQGPDPSRIAADDRDIISASRSGSSSNVRTEGYCDLPVLGADAERQMLDALAQQPVAVGVNIHALQFYDSGVVTIDDCPPADADPLRAINHAAVLTGWGHDEATDQYYWILRNTYGENWGEDGYARLAFGRDPETGFGTCALYTEGNYPLVGSLRCTPGAVRKEAVAHGSRVWLYPGGYNMGPRDRAGPRGGVAGVLEEVWSGVAGAIPGLDALAFASDDAAKWGLGAAGALAAASVAIMAVQARRLAGMRAGGGAGERVRLLATEEGVRGGGERR